jgi:hypothetical protein
MSESTYVRLPGSAANLVVRSSLWLGNDHLLAVEATSFHERYRRFYFGDVQAIHVRRTRRQATVVTLLAVLLAAVSGASLMIRASFDSKVAAFVFFAIAGLPLMVALLVEIARGPRASVTLYTAVGAVPLPSLNRVRTADRVLSMLGHRITAVQGAIAPGTFGAAPHDRAATDRHDASPPGASSSPVEPDHGELPRAAFIATLFGHSLASGMLVAAPGKWVGTGWAATAAMLLVLASTVLWATPRSFRRARACALSSIGYALTTGMVVYLGVIVASALRGVAKVDPSFASRGWRLDLSWTPVRIALGFGAAFCFLVGLVAVADELGPKPGGSSGP